jgi:hypothetical protein
MTVPNGTQVDTAKQHTRLVPRRGRHPIVEPSTDCTTCGDTGIRLHTYGASTGWFPCADCARGDR